MNYSNYLSKNTCAIFLFHGVIKKKDDDKILNCIKKHITEKKFYSIIEKLSKKGNSISLDDFLYFKKNKKKLPPNSYIITFDDGFYNNLSIAIPILEKFNNKAIFYLTTNFIKKNYMSWTDRIDYAVKKTREGSFLINKKKLSFKNNTKDKINFLLSIRKIAKSNLSINSNKLADKIQKKFIKKIVKKSNLPIYKKLNWKNINKILKNENFTIGCHTRDHEILSKLDNYNLSREITESLSDIKKNCKITVKHYAYPDGHKLSFNSKVIKVLKNNKIISSPTAINGINFINADPFKLKRIFVS